jgi:hypothetical protein
MKFLSVASLFSFFLFPFSFAVSAQPLPERLPLIGKVLTTSGAPIGGATVMAKRQDDSEIVTAAFWGGLVRTGSDGIFSFPEAEEGIYFLTIEAEGYNGINWTLNWKPGVPRYEARLLKLTPLLLRFTNPDGTPLSGAKVQLYLRSELPPRPPYPSPVSDAEGNVVVASQVPGRYWIHAVVPGKGQAILPAVQLKENAPEIVTAKLQPGGRVRAIAKSSDGKPMGGVALSLTEVLPNENALGNDGSIHLYTQPRSTLVTRDKDGTFEISDVAPGRYQARLFMMGEPGPAAQTIEVKAGETADVNGVFSLSKANAPLSVTVQTVAGAAAANREFILRLQPVVNGNPVPLGQAGPPLPPDVPTTIATLFQGSLLRRFRTDGEGKATLYPLRPGDWRATLLEPDKEIPRESASPQPQQLPSETVKIGADGGAVTFKLKQ